MLLKSLLFFHVDGQDWLNAIAFGGLQPTYGPVLWLPGWIGKCCRHFPPLHLQLINHIQSILCFIFPCTFSLSCQPSTRASSSALLAAVEGRSTISARLLSERWGHSGMQVRELPIRWLDPSKWALEVFRELLVCQITSPNLVGQGHGFGAWCWRRSFSPPPRLYICHPSQES